VIQESRIAESEAVMQQRAAKLADGGAVTDDR